MSHTSDYSLSGFEQRVAAARESSVHVAASPDVFPLPGSAGRGAEQTLGGGLDQLAADARRAADAAYRHPAPYNRVETNRIEVKTAPGRVAEAERARHMLLGLKSVGTRIQWARTVAAGSPEFQL